MLNLKCPITGNQDLKLLHKYTKAPDGEINLNISNYYREIWQSSSSKHYISIHDYDMSDLYSNQYVEATYNDEKGIEENFNRIINLPEKKSDNKARVQRVNTFSTNYFGNNSQRKLLDVGSGLGVFPYEMKRKGYKVTAIDPDQRAIKHASNVVGVEAFNKDFMKFDSKKKFEIITFNKVLEHVDDPIKLLNRSLKFLDQNGFVYVEVPDGEMASKDPEGYNREEFFIDHLHVFSFQSLLDLGLKAGFIPQSIERLQEPSSKYTLRAFFIAK